MVDDGTGSDRGLPAFVAEVAAALDGRAVLALGAEEQHRGDLRGVPGHVAVVIATSGSTGVPKRVMLGAAALRASAAATAARLGAGQWVLALPRFYVAGLQVVVRSVLAGTAPVAVEGRFGAEGFAAATDAAVRRRGGGALLTSLVPAQLATLVAAAEGSDRRARDALAAYDAILVGGQALPAPLRERAAALGARIVRTYGSSETAGGCVYDGRPLDGVEVRAVDGELRIAGPTLAEGYLGDGEGTARVFPADAAGRRWYRTGDLGEVVGGTVRVTGRVDNVIVSGGINVSLDRIERLVRGLPGWEDAVVVGVPDARWGEVPAVATTHRAAAEDPAGWAALRELVGRELGAPARPARVLVVAELPQLPSGKPDRRRLRDLLAPPPVRDA